MCLTAASWRAGETLRIFRIMEVIVVLASLLGGSRTLASFSAVVDGARFPVGSRTVLFRSADNDFTRGRDRSVKTGCPAIIHAFVVSLLARYRMKGVSLLQRWVTPELRNWIGSGEGGCPSGGPSS
jgi:hypothetical protein